jgi:transcriptional/translational regulatory protein YebC/TACO1
MASTSKRQQTMAKRNREQAVREKRARKLAKKYAAAAERNGTADEHDVFGPRSANQNGGI